MELSLRRMTWGLPCCCPAVPATGVSLNKCARPAGGAKPMHTTWGQNPLRNRHSHTASWHLVVTQGEQRSCRILSHRMDVFVSLAKAPPKPTELPRHTTPLNWTAVFRLSFFIFKTRIPSGKQQPWKALNSQAQVCPKLLKEIGKVGSKRKKKKWNNRAHTKPSALSTVPW